MSLNQGSQLPSSAEHYRRSRWGSTTRATALARTFSLCRLSCSNVLQDAGLSVQSAAMQTWLRGSVH